MRSIGLLLMFWCGAVVGAPVGGTPAAVQTAIDSARDGDTIEIAAGTFDWSSGVKIVGKFVKLRGSGDKQTTIRNTTGSNDWNTTMVSITPATAGSIEVSNLRFVRGNGSVSKHLMVLSGTGAPPLVHNCYFENTGFGPRCIEWQNNGGVCYDCEFKSSDKSDSSALAFKNPGSDSAWKEAGFLGNKDTNGTKNTYVEDCTFTDLFLQAMDVDDNSRAVVRHCVFNNAAMSSHGLDTSPIGMRQFEVYDNEFIFNKGGDCNPNPYPLNLNYWFYVRGGTGVIYNNTWAAISSCAWGAKPCISLTVYNINRRSSYIPCQTTYPAIRQCGFGSDANGRQVSDPIYIWGNTGSGNQEPGLVTYSPDDCGNGKKVDEFLKKGRDYFVGSPKSGYVAYTYPHPLRSGGGGGGPSPTPTATPAPSATPPEPVEPPQPTPTPGPSATPTPPAGSKPTYHDWLNSLSDWIRQHPAVPDQ